MSAGSRPLELSPAEVRVLGCLVEKQRTTPDAYPLSLNSLRLACNQSTNRDPVVSYDEHEVREAVQRLSRRGLARLASGVSSRAAKYRHLLAEALPVGDAQTALLCVLMLRGPQTPGELKARSERLHEFADIAAVHEALSALIDAGLAQALERRPGQKEERYRHLLQDPAAPGDARSDDEAVELSADQDALEERVARLERDVEHLREQLRTATGQ